MGKDAIRTPMSGVQRLDLHDREELFRNWNVLRVYIPIYSGE
jgi:hypothetical protein